MDLRLETAENKYGLGSLPRERAAEGAVYDYWPPYLRHGHQPPEGLVLGAVTYAFAQHGRWLAKCPFCNSAQVTSHNDQRFFCVECSNGGLGGWIRVEWPDEPDSIEEALLVRHAINQNWNPGESLAQLHAENTAHRGDEDAFASAVSAFGVGIAEQAALKSTRDAAALRDEAVAQHEDPKVLTARGELPTPPPKAP